jgi:hypothetical protein
MAESFEDLTAMGVLGDLGTLIGLGQAISSIFGGSGSPSAGEIAALVEQEMEVLFFQQTADAVISSAADTLDAVRTFLAVDYANAQAAGQSNAELWALLNSSSSPGIANLEEAQDGLTNWLQTNSGTPPGTSGSYMSRAASVGLGLALHICLLHRERAKVAPDDPTKATELDDMRGKARIAIAGDSSIGVPGFEQPIEATINGRTEQLPLLAATWKDRNDDVHAMTRIPDSWLAGTEQFEVWMDTDLFRSGEDADTAFSRQAPVMRPLYTAYRRVLWDGFPDDCTTLQNSFPPDGWGTSGWDFNNGTAFSTQNFGNICAFGNWVKGARTTLMALDLIASGLTGQQEDDWHVCQQCNALFQGIDDLPCPAGGVHEAAISPNFVMRQQVQGSTTPPDSESVWNKCTQCSGVFRWDTGGVCASGGSHVAGQAYFMCTGDPPDATQRGISNATGGFACCEPCGLLYFPAGNLNVSANSFMEFQNNGVCPAGGPHQSSLATPPQYWLSWIGFWKGLSPLVI